MGALPRIPSSGVGSTAVTELSEYGKAQRSAAFPEGKPVHFAYSSRAPSRGCASRPSDATGLIARYENSRFRLRKKKKVGKTGNVSRASPALHRSAGNSEAEIRS